MILKSFCFFLRRKTQNKTKQKRKTAGDIDSELMKKFVEVFNEVF